MAAKTSVGITSEFIEAIRSALSQTTVKHLLIGGIPKHDDELAVIEYPGTGQALRIVRA